MLLQILDIAVQCRAVIGLIGYLSILERGFDFVNAILQALGTGKAEMALDFLEGNSITAAVRVFHVLDARI